MIVNGFTATVTRRTPSGTDAHNNPTYTTADHTIERCAFAPAAGAELTVDGRGGVLVAGTLYCDNPDADLQADDLVTLDDGRQFEVDGAPGRWANPYAGKARGLVAALRRVEG